MPQRVKVGTNKYCYSGPTCKLHSTFWVADAQKNLKEARKNLEAANTFEEFSAAKAKIVEAQENYDATGKGFNELTREVANATGAEKATLKERQEKAAKTQTESAAKAATDFLSSQTAEARQADVFTTKDEEKIRLYASDTDRDVRANLALNPQTPVSILRDLSNENDEKIQGNVVLNSSTSTAVLKRLADNGVSSYVKVLAKSQLKKKEEAAKKATEAKAAKTARAYSVSSYSYRGKGGGK